MLHPGRWSVVGVVGRDRFLPGDGSRSSRFMRITRRDRYIGRGDVRNNSGHDHTFQTCGTWASSTRLSVEDCSGDPACIVDGGGGEIRGVQCRTGGAVSSGMTVWWRPPGGRAVRLALPWNSLAPLNKQILAILVSLSSTSRNSMPLPAADRCAGVRPPAERRGVSHRATARCNSSVADFVGWGGCGGRRTVLLMQVGRMLTGRG